MAKRGAARRLPGEEPHFPAEMKRPYGMGLSSFELPDIDVAGLRKRLGLSQARFAHRFGFPVSTLRHWEQGIRRPRGCALALLHVISRFPANATRAILAAKSASSTGRVPQPQPPAVASLEEIEKILAARIRRRAWIRREPA